MKMKHTNVKLDDNHYLLRNGLWMHTILHRYKYYEPKNKITTMKCRTTGKDSTMIDDKW